MDDLEIQLKEAQYQIEEADALANKILDEVDNFNPTVANIESQIKTLQSQLYTVRETRATVQNRRFEALRVKKEAEAKVESVRRQLADKLQQDAKLEEFNNFSLSLDEFSKDYPWFDQAMDHQLIGAKQWVYGQRMLLGDSMGTGKTATAIIGLDLIRSYTKTGTYVQIMDELHQVQASGRKIVWFCPSNVMSGALKEFTKWAPHRKVIQIGGKSKAQRKFILESLNENPELEWVIVCNYEAWRKDWALIEEIKACKPDTVVIDEAHNIKETSSIAYKGVKAVAVCASVNYVLPMTGTPILNKPDELYSSMSIVDPMNFFKLEYFRRDYCRKDYDTGKWGFQDGGINRLTKRMGHRYLKRTKAQCGILLPEPEIKHYELELTEEEYPDQYRAYTNMRDRAIVELADENVPVPVIIAWYTRLRQLITAPSGMVITLKDEFGHKILDEDTLEFKTEKIECEESIKLDFCITEDGEDGLIPEMIFDEKIVIYSQFTEPLNLLQERCERNGIMAAILDGNSSPDMRERIKERFINLDLGSPGGVDVLLCNYKVASVGIDGLQHVASQMILFDREWNPGKEDQTIDRLNRMGQTKQVTVHIPHVKETVEDWLSNLIAAKRDLIEGFDLSAAMNDFVSSLKAGKI